MENYEKDTELNVLLVGFNTSRIERIKSESGVTFQYLDISKDSCFPGKVEGFKKEVSENRIWRHAKVSVAKRMSFLDYSMAEKIMERHLLSSSLGEDTRAAIVGAVSYWVAFFENNRFDGAYYGTAAPHAFWNYTLSVAAKICKIPQWTIVGDFISFRVSLMEYPGVEVFPLSNSNSELLKIDKFCESQIADLKHPVYIKTYLSRGRSFLRTILYTLPRRYAKNFFKDPLTNFDLEFYDFRKKKLFQFFKRFYFDFLLIFKLKSLKKSYKKNEIKAAGDLDTWIQELGVENKVVVFFASFQPEATTTPDAGYFNNAKQVIAELQGAGFTVLYKEHPVTFMYEVSGTVNRSAIYKNKLFYEELVASGVILLPVDYDNKKIVCSGYKLVTCSGTIALQAILNGAQSLVLGRTWYGRPPGVAESIEQLHEDYSAMEKQKIGKYLKQRWSGAGKNVVGVMTGKCEFDQQAQKEFFEYIAKSVVEKVAG